ncbi:MAG: hypothetical protein J6V25_03215, partial [Oscillospiraceae bacterium]|nr:hypothetical protein [Oscillospiraceae bacterium]
ERERNRKLAEEKAKEQMRLDSLAAADRKILEEAASRRDSLAAVEAQALDSLSVTQKADSLESADVAVKELTPEEVAAAKKAEKARIKAEKKAKREAEKKRKQEALEAKWEEMDRRDAEKAALKEEKRLAKERQRKRKALEDAARRAQKEADLLEKYKRRYSGRKPGSN